MKTIRQLSLFALFALIALLVCSPSWGQSANPTGTQPVTTQTLAIPLLNAPQSPQSLTDSQVGTPGPTSSIYYYWVVADFLVGNSTPAGPVPAYNANTTLNGSNYNMQSWAPVANAVSYDVLRTTTPTMPTGACACAVVVATTSTTANDQSNSLNAYTVNTFNPNNVLVQIDNEATGPGTSLLTIRQGATSPTAGAKNILTQVIPFVDPGAKTASISSTPIVAANSYGNAQMWSLNWYMDSTTTCATPGPAGVTLTFSWTDDGAARTFTTSSLALGVNSATSLLNGAVTMYVAANAAINYSTTYTACTTGTGTYQLHIAPEVLRY